MRIRIGLVLFALAFPAGAAERTLQLTPENTKIEWTLGDTLHTVHGTFRLKRGTISFDEVTGKAAGEVVVDLTSGESGSAGRDKDMHRKVLESAKYPDAVFTPDRMDGKLKLHGLFKIHGASHELTMDVQSTTTADRITADITFDIPYVAWGMKDPSNFLLKVGKTVHLSIHTNAKLE